MARPKKPSPKKRTARPAKQPASKAQPEPIYVGPGLYASLNGEEPPRLAGYGDRIFTVLSSHPHVYQWMFHRIAGVCCRQRSTAPNFLALYSVGWADSDLPYGSDEELRLPYFREQLDALSQRLLAGNHLQPGIFSDLAGLASAKHGDRVRLLVCPDEWWLPLTGPDLLNCPPLFARGNYPHVMLDAADGGTFSIHNDCAKALDDWLAKYRCVRRPATLAPEAPAAGLPVRVRRRLPVV